MPDDRFHLVSFKWNVHTQARTAPQKYLTEIVHDNPVWINTRTALKLGIKTGDEVEITTYRPKGATYRSSGDKVGSAVVRAIVTEGIHPRVLAMSNSLAKNSAGAQQPRRTARVQKMPALQLTRQLKTPILCRAYGGIKPQGARALVTTSTLFYRSSHAP